MRSIAGRPVVPVLFLLSCAGATAIAQLEATPAWVVTSGQGASSFGHAVKSAGDVNGDGYGDVIVGAPSYSNGEGGEGRAYVYYGSATGLSTTPSWTAEIDVVDAGFGSGAAGAGDVDGDGYDDVIVGAIYFSMPQHWEGSAWLYRGSASGLSATPSWSVQSNLVNNWMGASVSGAGDVDADGYSDALVGAPGTSGLGRCLVYRGSASGLGAAAAPTLTSPQSNSAFASRVAGAGDVNADGYDDVLVGAGQYTNGQNLEGAAFLYLGSSAGTSTTAAWSAEGGFFNAGFGGSIARAGDVDGDGFGDVVVGAPGYPSGSTVYGDAFVYRGTATGLAANPAWQAGPQQADSHFGSGVAGGDVNGDGFSDVIVGADSFNGFSINDGRAYVYLGSAAGVSPLADWCAQPANTHQYFGLAIGAAGDVNGDGLADFVAGGHNFDNGENRAWLYEGCATCAGAGYYGTGKLGTGFPRLYTEAPALGGHRLITLTGVANNSSAFLMAGAAPASIPFDAGTLLVVPSLIVGPVPTNSSGTMLLAVTLPADPLLQGVEAYFQGFCVAPPSPGPYHTIQSNGVHWTLGS